MNKLIILLLPYVALTIIVGCSCSNIPVEDKSISSQFDIELIDIGQNFNLDLYSAETTFIPEKLPFRVAITPKQSFSGEPFRIVQDSNEVTEHQTISQSSPDIWLVLLTKDELYIDSNGPLTWTPAELRSSGSSQEDNENTQMVIDDRTKHVSVHVSSSEQATKYLLQDIQDLQNKQWSSMIHPGRINMKDILKGYENLFNQYFILRIVDSDKLRKLKYPD